MVPELAKRVTDWCDQDKDEETRAVILKLREENNEEELEARLGTRKSAKNHTLVCS